MLQPCCLQQVSPYQSCESIPVIHRLGDHDQRSAPNFPLTCLMSPTWCCFNSVTAVGDHKVGLLPVPQLSNEGGPLGCPASPFCLSRDARPAPSQPPEGSSAGIASSPARQMCLWKSGLCKSSCWSAQLCLSFGVGRKHINQ